MDRDDDKVFGLTPLPRRRRRPTKRHPTPEPDDGFPDERDVAAIRGELIDMGKRRGYGPERIMKWPQMDDYESLLFFERWEAHQVAEVLKIDVEAAWSRRRMRPWQEVEFVLKGPITFSKHYEAKFSSAWAEAAVEYPHDSRLRALRATEIVMAHGNQRTWEAWHTYTFENVSMFEPVHDSKQPHGGVDETVRLDLIADTSTTGRDPQEHRTFLDALLDESDLTEREKDVVEMIAYDGETNMTEMARRLGVTDTTIGRDIETIKESRVWTDWIGSVESVGPMTRESLVKWATTTSIEDETPEPPSEGHRDTA